MKILFLHGWQSTPGGLKPTYLNDHGHTVLNPALPDDDFDAAVRIAQAEFDQGKPDVVVGSSRGGAVAMNIDAGTTPLVLLCPAWKFWGTATTVKPGTTILHSRADETVPFAYREFSRNPDLTFDQYKERLGREVFGDAASPQDVDDLLALQAIFATERTWCQPAPVVCPERVRAMKAQGTLTPKKRDEYLFGVLQERQQFRVEHAG